MGMNVYADLGFENPEMELAKARIVSVLRDLLEEKCLSDAEAGQRLGITAAEVDNIFDGHWDNYSVDCLMAFVHTFNASIHFDPDTGRVIEEAAAPFALTA